MDNQNTTGYIEIKGFDPEPREKKIGAFFTSWDNDKILPAFGKALGEIEVAAKDAKNPYYNSQYADLASCKRAIDPALKENGLSLAQPSSMGDDGKTIIVYNTIIHASGQYIRWDFSLPLGTKLDPQEVGKAVTYARRYALSGLGIVTDIDDDGNNASGKDVKAAPTRQQPPPPPAKQAKPAASTQAQKAEPPQPQPPQERFSQKTSAEDTSLSDMFIKISEAHPGATEPAVRKFLASCRIDKEPEDLQVRFLKLYITNRDYAKFGQRWKDTGKTFEECIKEAETNGIEKLEWCQIKAA